MVIPIDYYADKGIISDKPKEGEKGSEGFHK